MSKPALMNVALIAARLGSRELEFAAKKVHAMKVSKKGPTDYVSEADRKIEQLVFEEIKKFYPCLLYTSPSPRDRQKSRMPSSA